MIEQLAELPAQQQPSWRYHPDYENVMATLSARDGLVDIGGIARLSVDMASVAAGDAFLLQAGDCVENLSDGAEKTQKHLKTVLAMTMVLMFGAGVQVVKTSRIGGQFAKPRSSDTEVVDGIELPSFRGEMVNGFEATAEARAHDPNRMLHVYDHATRSLRTIDQLSKGGFANIEQMHAWNVEFAEQSSQRERYLATTDAIDRAIRFMKASGVTENDLRSLHEAEIYTAHEGLVRDYELGLTKQVGGNWYDTSAHFLWIGDRTKGLDDFHVQFFSKIANPIGGKVGPNTTPEELVRLCDVLNPNRTPGRLTLISRMGRELVGRTLPQLVEAVQQEGHEVIWAVDPMHGNTRTHASGRKTRHFDDVAGEVTDTFAIHRANGSRLGGLHVESTGGNVTECLGGSSRSRVEDLGSKYDTFCDPRLNADQSLELAFLVSELLAQQQRAA